MTVCGECGYQYEASSSGRHNHRMLLGHVPSPQREPIPVVSTEVDYWCRIGKHRECGGGVIGGLPCACTCGHEVTW